MPDRKIIKVLTERMNDRSDIENPMDFIRKGLSVSGLTQGCELFVDDGAIVITATNLSFHNRILGALIGLRFTKDDVEIVSETDSDEEVQEETEFSKLTPYFKGRVVESISSELFMSYFMGDGIKGNSEIRSFKKDVLHRFEGLALGSSGVIHELDEAIDALSIMLLRSNNIFLNAIDIVSLEAFVKARDAVITDMLETGKLKTIEDYTIFQDMVLEEMGIE